MAAQASPSGYLERPRSSGLADVIDIILDKGLVIDAYLRFAEAVNRLDLTQTGNAETLPELVEDMTERGSKSKTKGAVEGAKEKLLGSKDEEEEKPRRSRSRSAQRSRRSSEGGDE